MISFNPVEAEIYLGSAPRSAIDVARLSDMDVTAILSLQSDEDFRTHDIDWRVLRRAYQSHHMVVYRYPIKDFSEEDLALKVAQPVRALNSLLKAGHRVYVHCNAGVCRAPATVLGYLCHYRGMQIEEGLEYIRVHRPQANPYLGAVKAAILELERLEPHHR